MEEETRSSKDGRVPPQDVVAEKSLLGALMISNEVARRTHSITPAGFLRTATSNYFSGHRGFIRSA